MLTLPLSLRLIMRDLRSGELTLLCVALFLAVTCMSAMQQFSEMVRFEGERSAAAFLGADAVVSRSEPMPVEWRKKAQQLGVKQTQTINFLSMAVHDKKLQLVQVKAVDALYPLRGKLIISPTGDTEKKILVHAPLPGSVWINHRLLPLLSLKIGQTLTIGAAEFVVKGIIIEEPGQRGDWLSISPQLLMNQRDIQKTQTLQQGSKVTYNWLLSGQLSQLNQLKQFLQANLGRHLQWSDHQQGSPAIDVLTQRTLCYLNLGTLMSLLLGGVAISMATLRYGQRHLRQVALLRCFGATQQQIVSLYMMMLFIVGVLSTAGGILMGLVLQPLLMHWLGSMLVSTAHVFHYWPMVFSFLVGMGLLFVFSAGNFWALKRVSAMHIFGQQHFTWSTQQWLPYLLGLVLLMGMGYFYTQSWAITQVVIFGVMVFMSLVMASLGGLSLFTKYTKDRMPLNWRFGLNNIVRNRENSGLQITGIGLAITAILTLSLFKTNVLDAWQQDLPANTANYFLINIAPEQVLPLKKWLQQAHVQPTDIYPMVRGRLVNMNGQNVQRLFGERAKEINALQRELNFSWTSTLPVGNKLVAGRWSDASSQINWVSVEEGLAKRLALKLGDTIGIRVGEDLLTAKVTSFRAVDWNSFKPNFFMLFRPGFLKHQPQTMITSFYLSPEQTTLLPQLTQTFPNLTIIDLASTLKKVREMINKLGHAMNFMAVFCLFIGLVIAILAMLSFNATKQAETRLLKILGMRQRTLLWIRSSEAMMLGLYTGLLACTVALTICYLLSLHFLGTAFTFPWKLVLFVPLITAILNLGLNLIVQYHQYQARTPL